MGGDGPVFGFSDTWQRVINTGTTVVTFLMVFLIQSTQNRDSEAMQVKLDETRIHRRHGDTETHGLSLPQTQFASSGGPAIVSSTTTLAARRAGNVSRRSGGVTIVVTSTMITAAEKTSRPMIAWVRP